MESRIDLNHFLSKLDQRNGLKPHTIGSKAHDQMNQHPFDEKYALELHDFILSFENVVKSKSDLGVGSENAFFISSSGATGESEYFLHDNEFAHIHDGESQSLHLVLPPEVAVIAGKNGWIEKYPASKKSNIYLLFGARNEYESTVSKKLIYISYLFATKQW
jgi:phospholipase/carboxylesterase